MQTSNTPSLDRVKAMMDAARGIELTEDSLVEALSMIAKIAETTPPAEAERGLAEILKLAADALKEAANAGQE